MSKRFANPFILLALLSAFPVLAAAGSPIEMPAPSELAARYYHSGNLLWVISNLLGLFFPALLLFTGWSSRLRQWSFRLGGSWYLAFAIYLGGFLVYSFAVDFPLAYYVGFVREHQFGLSNQTFSKWISDFGTELGIAWAMGAAFLWVPFLILRKAPRAWWWITAALAVPYYFFVMLVQPIWIAPLFNDFGPMQNRVLEKKILDLSHRARIDSDRVYEVNKSVDTKKMNAYVTGFLGTKRIVIWDTLAHDLDEAEVISVMGHEMGHYVLNHVVQGVLVTSVLTLLGLYLIQLSAHRLMSRFRRRFGFDELADFASLPLLILLIGIFSFFLAPFGLAFSRHIEHEADRFALEITRDNISAMRAEVDLVKSNLAYPRPARWVVILRYSHPPSAERFDFARDYHPWKKGEPLKYAEYFGN